MRREQAAELHTRLHEACEAGDRRLVRRATDLRGDSACATACDAALAHARWLSEPEAFGAARRELALGLERYWERKAFGASSGAAAELFVRSCAALSVDG